MPDYTFLYILLSNATGTHFFAASLKKQNIENRTPT